MDFRSGRPRIRHERRRKDHQTASPGNGLPAALAQPERRQSNLAVIRWKDVDGTESCGHPLPRAHAEALIKAFVGQYPLPTFWLEIPPALDDAIRYR